MMDWIALAAFAAVNLLAASSGAVFAPGAWYERLAKPGWTPPNWAFPVVWSIVFALIAYAGWLFWLEAGFERGGVGLALYGLNLILNAAWSAIFFGLKRPDWAFAEVILLWASIVAVIVAFAPLSPVAAALLLPYLAWVTAAALLNFQVWRLNPWTTRPEPAE